MVSLQRVRSVKCQREVQLWSLYPRTSRRDLDPRKCVRRNWFSALTRTTKRTTRQAFAATRRDSGIRQQILRTDTRVVYARLQRFHSYKCTMVAIRVNGTKCTTTQGATALQVSQCPSRSVDCFQAAGCDCILRVHPTRPVFCPCGRVSILTIN